MSCLIGVFGGPPRMENCQVSPTLRTSAEFPVRLQKLTLPPQEFISGVEKNSWLSTESGCAGAVVCVLVCEVEATEAATEEACACTEAATEEACACTEAATDDACAGTEAATDDACAGTEAATDDACALTGAVTDDAFGLTEAWSGAVAWD